MYSIVIIFIMLIYDLTCKKFSLLHVFMYLSTGICFSTHSRVYTVLHVKYYSKVSWQIWLNTQSLKLSKIKDQDWRFKYWTSRTQTLKDLELHYCRNNLIIAQKTIAKDRVLGTLTLQVLAVFFVHRIINQLIKM